MKTKWSTSGAALAPLLLLVAAGCADKTAPSAPSPSTPTASVSATTTRTPEPPTVVSLPGGGTTTLRRAPATVYTGCGESTRSSRGAFSFEAGEVFVPALRRNLPLPQPTVPAGAELVGGECFVTGDEQKIRVIYIADFRTPSSGLSPESTATLIISFDPSRPETPVAT